MATRTLSSGALNTRMKEARSEMVVVRVADGPGKVLSKRGHHAKIGLKDDKADRKEFDAIIVPGGGWALDRFRR